jgi:hypothetical protein
MEQKQLTQEEFKKLTDLKESFFNLTVKLGQAQIDRLFINSQLEQLNQHIADLETKYSDLRKEELQLNTEISSKYGDVVVDIETGNFSVNS